MNAFSKEPSFRETGLRSVITEFALALTALRDDHWHPSGTAIVVSPYLAITAKHVIEDYWSRYDGVFPQGGSPSVTTELAGSFSLWACQVLNEGETGALWEVTRLWLSPHTDVAFLRLTPASEAASAHRWRMVHMNLLPPSVGTRVVAFGYPGSSIGIQDTKEKTIVEWKDSPTTTVGEVVESYETYRDKSMLTFPCFQINARVEPGMSGGPVFNDEGQLCGLICSSFTTDPEGKESHVSFVASLWPSMGTKLDMNREGYPSGESYPALDLARHGHIKARNWERVTLVEDTYQVGLRVERPNHSTH